MKRDNSILSWTTRVRRYRFLPTSLNTSSSRSFVAGGTFALNSASERTLPSFNSVKMCYGISQLICSTYQIISIVFSWTLKYLIGTGYSRICGIFIKLDQILWRTNDFHEPWWKTEKSIHVRVIFIKLFKFYQIDMLNILIIGLRDPIRLWELRWPCDLRL